MHRQSDPAISIVLIAANRYSSLKIIMAKLRE